MKWLLAIGLCFLALPSALAQLPGAARTAVPGQRLSSLGAPLAQPSIHPAVARIVAPGNGTISFGSGTLVFANEQFGIVITNWHVINEATGQISVHFPDGFYSVGAVQNVDRDWDLAAIAIRKPPNVQPVPLASRAPRPGDVLTIAGYGSGNYRAASGRCTQYVAPGTTFPFEMVEVAVSARQGDSGGPIFNTQGELAGVLFGEGNGRTSGSYCGRVKWFLASVVPGGARAGEITQPQPPLIAVAPRPQTGPAARTLPVASQVQDLAAIPIERSAPIERVPIERPAPPITPPRVTSAPSQIASLPPVTPRGAAPAALEPQVIGWQDLAGETTGEQIKSVLAAIGVLAVVLHLLRWMSREPAAKAKA